MDKRVIRRALLSVSDKTGLVEFARGLSEFGVELISTGGTRQALAGAGLAVRDISDITGFPEMLDGRVKTLHPHVHGAILAIRDDAEHARKLKEHGIDPIDLVVCNLYPFQATVAKNGSTHAEIIENIDIGGPAMLRSAAKNYQDVAVLVEPGQYGVTLAELREHQGALTLVTRERLAATAFAHVAEYDAAIDAYFSGRVNSSHFPEVLAPRWHRRQSLRYGENPHQPAAFYVDSTHRHSSVASAEVLHGKELSFNNILDLDSALNLVREFSEPASVVIKHNNPCGAAVASTLAESFQNAYEGDPLSAFGGVLAFNRPIDDATAMLITEPNRFIECIIAPGYSDTALALLTKKKNLRLLRIGPLADDQKLTTLTFRDVEGGVLVQERDTRRAEDDFRARRSSRNAAQRRKR